ncbi:RNA 2'-phosphotransferase [Mycobacterium alsense]|uniref:RNA 2'-phosphotransferase n=1 Tax=Mycobacterium alsense TaxID=324058 RepID=UPI001FD2E48F|nr:RNA 2'-phosphotransferase [Mycobacterium alsense]
MAYLLKVDPVALHAGSADMFNAAGEAAVGFVGHEEALAGAAPGWVGSSQLALAELAARWELRHDHHQLLVGGLGSHVAEAMVGYVTNEDDSARALRSVRE